MEISSGVSMEFGKRFKISATETTTELMAKLRLLLLPLRPPFPQVEELHSMDQWKVVVWQQIYLKLNCIFASGPGQE